MIQLENISRDLKKVIISELDRIHIFYRLFDRPKSVSSTKKKIESKGYHKDGNKLQDSIGIRIILYFPDDIPLVKKILSDLYTLNNEEEDPFDHEIFRPQRMNYVYNLNASHTNEHQAITNSYGFDCIDPTFEIQLRTVFSEGWHEVEHDLRYKCKPDWEKAPSYSRILNGIYATLETSEWSMTKLFDSLAYNNYHERNWNSMLRNKFRLRFSEEILSKKLTELLNSNPQIAKSIYKCNRNSFIQELYEDKARIPLTFSNIVYLLNHYELNTDEIKEITPAEFFEVISTN